MGEISDMIIEGLLDEVTGEYIGDENLDKFGIESPGFPVSYEEVPCPHCEKMGEYFVMVQHIKDEHNIKKE